MQPLAPERIRLAHGPGALIALHLLDRRFRRQAGGDRLMQPLHPALIVREHAIGFEHLAMLAGARHFAVGQHVIDGLAQLRQRDVETGLLGADIFGEKLGDADARLMQHDMSKRDAVRHGDAA